MRKMCPITPPNSGDGFLCCPKRVSRIFPGRGVKLTIRRHPRTPFCLFGSDKSLIIGIHRASPSELLHTLLLRLLLPQTGGMCSLRCVTSLPASSTLSLAPSIRMYWVHTTEEASQSMSLRYRRILRSRIHSGCSRLVSALFVLKRLTMHAEGVISSWIVMVNDCPTRHIVYYRYPLTRLAAGRESMRMPCVRGYSEAANLLSSAFLHRSCPSYRWHILHKKLHN
ncbi:hypothetical protein K474DRAFT_423609 [Panus rudis PR-1116 ss-1]|nr:hypothetical protein K474DRAFT_423609 [Panus rudis PR-1116 ss-1]